MNYYYSIILDSIRLINNRTPCAYKSYMFLLFSDLWTDREVMYVAYIGKLFLRMLKALILPLIIPSLIAAIGQLDMTLSGKIGGRAVAYYMSTTVLAVILGIILVTSIQPGAEQTATEGVEGVNPFDFIYTPRLKYKVYF